MFSYRKIIVFRVSIFIYNTLRATLSATQILKILNSFTGGGYIISSHIEIKKKDETKVLDYVIRASNLVGPNQSFEGRDYLDFERIIYIISGLINIGQYPNNNSLKRKLIEDAIFRFKRYSVQTLPTFERAVSTEINALSKHPNKKYYVIIPFNIIQSSIGRGSVDIDSQQILIRSKSYVTNNFDLKKAVESLDLKEEQDYLRKSKISYLIAEIEAPSPLLATLLVSIKVDFYRAILNFYSIRLRHQEIFQTHPMPKYLSNVPPFRFAFAFDSDGKFIRNYWNDLSERASPKSYREDYKQVLKIVNRINKIKSKEIRDLIWNALGLHMLACDESSIGQTYLHFWQILELLSLSSEEERIKGDIIVSKIRKIMTLTDPYFKDLLPNLMEKRNELVHKGSVWDVTFDEVNYLKVITESTIGFMISQGDMFENKSELRDYFAFKDEPNVSLTRKIKMINAILKKRPPVRTLRP